MKIYKKVLFSSTYDKNGVVGVVGEDCMLLRFLLLLRFSSINIMSLQKMFAFLLLYLMKETRRLKLGCAQAASSQERKIPIETPT